jgi:hypothetical protein
MVVRYVLFVGVRIGWNFLAIFFSDAIIVSTFAFSTQEVVLLKKKEAKQAAITYSIIQSLQARYLHTSLRLIVIIKVITITHNPILTT